MHYHLIAIMWSQEIFYKLQFKSVVFAHLHVHHYPYSYCLDHFYGSCVHCIQHREELPYVTKRRSGVKK